MFFPTNASCILQNIGDTQENLSRHTGWKHLSRETSATILKKGSLSRRNVVQSSFRTLWTLGVQLVLQQIQKKVHCHVADTKSLNNECSAISYPNNHSADTYKNQCSRRNILTSLHQCVILLNNFYTIFALLFASGNYFCNCITHFFPPIQPPCYIAMKIAFLLDNCGKLSKPACFCCTIGKSCSYFCWAISEKNAVFTSSCRSDGCGAGSQMSGSRSRHLNFFGSSHCTLCTARG